MLQNTVPVSERWTAPSHGVASGKEIALYRDGGRSSRDTGFEDPSNGEDLMLHMANVTLELLRRFSTRNAEGHVKSAAGQQRRFHRFTQKAHRARRWLYRSMQQKGLTIARQQIQMLARSLDGQAEFSPLMAGGVGTISARAPRDPSCNRTTPSLALVMRFLPDGINRLINIRDRAEAARVFVALLNHWVSAVGGAGALTDLGTTRQLTSAEKSAKIVEAE
jgi:hypothetical protein